MTDTRTFRAPFMACEDAVGCLDSQTSRVVVALVAIVGLAVGPRGVEAQVADLDDLAWIAGHWAGNAFGGQIEEGWFGPAGRSMSGSFRLVQDDLAVMYELLLLEQDEDGEIYYRFKHVSRGWEPWEETRLEYRLTAVEGRKATFRSTEDEPAANAPWWFTYESPTPDELFVSIYGSGGGDPIVLSMSRR
ncbi:DUF6265 family protein [Candidatus Palauibacter sp.]|uniref:DUF6265 family protein n=1 Tax=Candidatus Palauibacter sp. TaxID=3101350 RepID=UPI003AF2EF40